MRIVLVVVFAIAGCSGPGTRSDEDHAISPAPPHSFPTPLEYEQDGFRARQVSTRNRYYDGSLMGGWGPHLRPLLRDSQSRLWHVVDAGRDNAHNESLLYYRFDGAWRLVAEQPQIPGVQQNAASVLHADALRTYAVATTVPRRIEECVLAVSSSEPLGCSSISSGGNPIEPPPESNYVGAAVSPTGTIVIWWTRVGVPPGTGELLYVFNDGTGWSAPIATDLAPYHALGYVYVAFVSGSELVLGAEAMELSSGSTAFSGVLARMTIGQPLTDLTVLHVDATERMEAVEDVWLEEVTGTLHVVAHDPQADRVGWFAVPIASLGTGPLIAAGIFDDAFRARFVEDGGGGLHLALGAEDGGSSPPLRIFTSSILDAQSPIDWSMTSVRVVPMPGALEEWTWPSGIYVESASMQEEPPVARHLVFVGEERSTDDEIWHLEF